MKKSSEPVYYLKMVRASDGLEIDYVNVFQEDLDKLGLLGIPEAVIEQIEDMYHLADEDHKDQKAKHK